MKREPALTLIQGDAASPPPLVPDSVDADCRQLLTLLHLPALRVETALVFALLLVFGAVDAALNWNVFSARLAVDEVGQSNGKEVLALATSLLTLAAFLVVGGAFTAGYRRSAVALYALLLALLGIMVAPLAVSLLTELVMNLGIGGGSFGAAEVKLPASVMWLGIAVVTLIYSMAGVLVCVAEHRLGDCWRRWKMRFEVVALQAQRNRARLPAVTADALGMLIFRTDMTHPEPAKIALTGAVADYLAAIEQRGDGARQRVQDRTLSKAQRNAAARIDSEARRAIDQSTGDDHA